LRISAIQRALWPASTSSERNNKILSNSALDRNRDTVEQLIAMRDRLGCFVEDAAGWKITG
jgi:hypothetical protein